MVGVSELTSEASISFTVQVDKVGEMSARETIKYNKTLHRFSSDADVLRYRPEMLMAFAHNVYFTSVAALKLRQFP